MQTAANPPMQNSPFRILVLDGGGAKGFYTLGVLSELEKMLGAPLSTRFDLMYGTSTGSIIAALLALGETVEEIRALYEEHVPAVMKRTTSGAKTAALTELSQKIFGQKQFVDFKTRIGIVATKWQTELPFIFKSNSDQLFGRSASFVPGFGVKVADAVRSSCSAYPFFDRSTIETSGRDRIELIDGGFCANNPSLYALADALGPLQQPPEQIRLVNIGVGIYPDPKTWGKWFFGLFVSVRLLQKTLEINTNSMDQLRSLLFSNIPTIRICDAFSKPELATDFLEHDLNKLHLLYQSGKASFAAREENLRQFFI